MAKGTRLIPLDTHTGLRSPGTDMYQFAGHEGEAGYVYYRKGYYYFFKNLGHCCAGLNSTSYRILVGRSHQITGPYVDKDGNDLATHPGTIFLQTDGDKIGPGQIGIYTDSGVDYVSFHYYSRALGGRPTLGIETLTWDADGWPVAGKDPQPPATVP
jgi:arabinan endo-1,5-alpha-L-arabinosidase